MPDRACMGTARVDTNFEADIAAVQRIDAVPRTLDIVCRLTGMGPRGAMDILRGSKMKSLSASNPGAS
jgi:hypothetical protein